MLGSIRKFSKSILAKIFIAIIALPFLLWGMGDIFTSGKQNVIVEIDDEKITSEEFVTYLQKVNITSDEIKKTGKSKIFDEVLANYISEKVIEIETQEKGIRLTDKSLMKILISDKTFQKDEKFSETKYEKFMLTSGYTKPQYERTLRNIELKGQLLTFYSGGIKLPKSIVDESYKKLNQIKEIDYLDLNKVYAKNIVSEEEINDFYEKNKSLFKEKFKSFRYLELSPEILIGEKDLDEIYFKKIDSIENKILDGEDFSSITSGQNKNIKNIDFLNFRKSKKDGTIFKEIDDKLFKKIFSIKKKKEPRLITLDNNYYIVEILDEKDIDLTLNDKNLREVIKTQLKFTFMIEENEKIIKKINNKEFNKEKIFELSKSSGVPIDKVKINTVKDKSKFGSKLVKEIYKFSKGQIFIVSGDFATENYLIHITDEKNPKIDFGSESYKTYIKTANGEYVSRVFKSYDNHINKKYEIETNEKVFERIKNSF